ncbi:MAG: hypothetical protein ACMXYG_07365 [Candidatus Woesearchaeota archaeon]
MVKVKGITGELIEQIVANNQDASLTIGNAVLDAVLSNYEQHSQQYKHGINPNFRRKEASNIEKSLEGLANNNYVPLLKADDIKLPQDNQVQTERWSTRPIIDILEASPEIWTVRYVVDIPFKLHEAGYNPIKISKFIGGVAIETLRGYESDATNLHDPSSDYQVLKLRLTEQLNNQLGVVVSTK